jgi:hypothetical protein
MPNGSQSNRYRCMATEFLVRKLYILTVIKFRTAGDGVCETITNRCGVKDIKLPETYNFDVLGEGPSSESYTIAFKCLHSKRRSSAVYTFQVVVYRHTIQARTADAIFDG